MFATVIPSRIAANSNVDAPTAPAAAKASAFGARLVRHAIHAPAPATPGEENFLFFRYLNEIRDRASATKPVSPPAVRMVASDADRTGTAARGVSAPNVVDSEFQGASP
jgi:hypothetical protein